MDQKKQKKVNRIKIVIFILLSVLIASYLIYAVYNLIKKPTDTFVIKTGKLSKEESTQGYIIRNEEVIKGENYKNGMAQIKTEGQKVATGEAIFRYYTKGEEELIEKIRGLDLKIQESWDNETNIFSPDTKLLDNQITEKLNEVYGLNDVQKIKEYKKEISSYITKKAKISGDLSPAGSYLKKLIQERSNYENQLNSGSEYIKATKSGVVSYRVDGLENVLTIDSLSSINKQILEKMKLKTGQVVASSEESGKIIDNFYCYISCILSSEEAKEAEVGKKVSLRLSNSKQVEAEVEYITNEEDGSRVVTFKIDKYVEELINYRKISVDVIWWNASGWKVPNTAIRYEEEIRDVAYVIRQRSGYTDKIYVKVLEQNENYAIIENYNKEELKEKGLSEQEVKERKTISLYDEIIIK